MQPSEPRFPDLEVRTGVVKQARTLRDSEALLAESQRLAKIGSFELDVATRMLTWSAQQFRNFGFDPAAEIARELVITRIHPLDLERHEGAVRRAIEGGEAFVIDYRVVHPDGTVHHIRTTGQPLRDADGRVAKIVGTSQDVSERVQLEDQLRAQCEQLQRLGELKSNFVNSVTHELRTPLTTIMGYAEFIQDQLLAPEHRRYIGQIQRGARRIEFLLNDLLDFALMEAGTFTLKLAPARLGELVREVLESLRPQAEEARLTLVHCLADGSVELELDTRRIGQVLTNLLSNAIKFAPGGSTVRVVTFQRGDRVRCEIEDAGPGIPPADLPKLFQRFSQLEAGVATGKGSGLGLSISKALVDAHGGSIGVRSTPGVGSTFWFELPLL
jgi:PAS domain S-box-containing protein